MDELSPGYLVKFGPIHVLHALKQRSPIFLAPGISFMEDNFSTDEAVGGFRMNEAHYIYCALYFYHYYISITSDQQALDPGSLEPLL